MAREGVRTVAKVFFHGDGSPLYCDETPEGILERLSSMAAMAAEHGLSDGEFSKRAFITLPLRAGEVAYARPDSIALVVPCRYDPDEED